MAALAASTARLSPALRPIPINAGPALDMAAAALILKGGSVFPSPGCAFRDFPATVAGGGEPVGADRISCLTLAGDEAFGLTTLGKLPGTTGE